MTGVGKRLPIQLANVGIASSYHFRILAPPDLVFVGPPNVTLIDPLPEGQAEYDLNGAEMTIYAQNVSRSSYILVYCKFGLDPRGFARVGFYVPFSVFMILLLGLLARVILGAEPQGEAVPAVLVALPAIYASYAVRPGEHRLATRFARDARRAVMMATSLSFLAAASLAVTWVFQPGQPSWHLGWRVLLWIYLMVFSALLVMRMAPRSEGWWSPVTMVLSRLWNSIAWTTIGPSRSNVAPGWNIIVSGQRFATWERVEIVMLEGGSDGARRHLREIAADSSGAFEARVSIPEDAQLGKARLQGKGLESGRFARASIRIQAAR